MPDIANAGCLILWGYNPSASRLPHATATVAAMKRGMRLVVVDPRHVGLANKTDVWLRVKPGSDGMLALGLANLMIERGWFDAAFIRTWTNGPLLVRSDTGRLLRSTDLAASTEPITTTPRFAGWDGEAGLPVELNPGSGQYGVDPERLALRGEVSIETSSGLVPCRPVFEGHARGTVYAHHAVLREPGFVRRSDGFDVRIGAARCLMPDDHDVGLLLGEEPISATPWPAPRSTVSPAGKRGVTSASRKDVHSSLVMRAPCERATCRTAARAWP
jgi:anaerobic selenocysteine-containing dehydrogenase